MLTRGAERQRGPEAFGSTTRAGDVEVQAPPVSRPGVCRLGGGPHLFAGRLPRCPALVSGRQRSPAFDSCCQREPSLSASADGSGDTFPVGFVSDVGARVTGLTPTA